MLQKTWPHKPSGWQRIPTNQGNKKSKIAQISSPEVLKTSNSYLWSLEDGEGNVGRVWDMGLRYRHSLGETQLEHCFTPVICETVVSLQSNWPIHADALFSYKIVNKNQMLISYIQIEVYKNFVGEKGLIGQTFNHKD